MNFISVIILVVLEAVVLLAAYTYDPQIFSDNGSILKLCWVMLLVLANWLASVLIFFKNRNVTKSPDFGSVPAINISVFTWSVLSFLAMLMMQHLSTNIHLTIQIILAGITAFLVLSMLLGSAAAKTDINQDTVLKRDLALSIEQIENNFDGDTASLKSLREQILYGLPHESKLQQSVHYPELVARIRSIEQSEIKPDEKVIQDLKALANKCMLN